MSQLIETLLLPRRDAERIAADLASLPFAEEVLELNERWSFVLSEPGWGLHLLSPQEAPAQAQFVRAPLLALSATAPLLYFLHAQDFGWGYAMFAEGTEAARLHVDYDANFAAALTDSEAGRPVLQPDCANAHPERFAYFGLHAEEVDRLRAVLAEAPLLQALSSGDYTQPVEQFMDVLDITALQEYF